jgi:cytochrome c oxidase assembly protein subunit 15
MKNQNRPVILWLLSGCVLLFVMVVVGGITRLTDSGLSMTDWHLVTDTFPPLTDEKWHSAFEEYKKYPEYQKINIHNDFTIDDYKFIYFWEWFHRFIGRIIGIVFLIPFVYFIIRKKLDANTVKKCIVLLLMGAFQGFLGWFMVRSGLIDNPDVSHFLTFAYTLWVALDLMYPERKPPVLELRKIGRIALFILILQIIYGGFVAGLNAGLIHNHWPLMSDGAFMHESVIVEQENWLLRLTEGKSGVQFVHRTLAYIVAAIIIYLFVKSKKYTLSSNQASAANTILAMVFVQFALGVFTLLLSVPLWLGLAHQVGAFILLASLTYFLHRVSK